MILESTQASTEPSVAEALTCPRDGDLIVLVGTDLVVVSDVVDSVATFGDRYLERVYTVAERDTCIMSSGLPDCSRLAARFAAKEAVIKVLGAIDETTLTNIEVATDERGRPAIRLAGQYRHHFETLGASSMAVSLSHDGPYATATVVVIVRQTPLNEEHEENSRT